MKIPCLFTTLFSIFLALMKINEHHKNIKNTTCKLLAVIMNFRLFFIWIKLEMTHIFLSKGYHNWCFCAVRLNCVRLLMVHEHNGGIVLDIWIDLMTSKSDILCFIVIMVSTHIPCNFEICIYFLQKSQTVFVIVEISCSTFFIKVNMGCFHFLFSPTFLKV